MGALRSGARLPRVLRFALGLLFLWAASSKFRDLGAFERTIGDFGIVFDAFVPLTALTLACAEAWTGAGLLVGWRSALPVALALELFFAGVLAYGLALGLDIDCGCFGPGEHTDLGQALRRDLVLLALSGYLYWRERHESKGQRT